MKAGALPSPALCQLPLIKAPRPITKADAAKRPANFPGRIASKIWGAIASRVPVGYEDETGFHHGTAEVPQPANESVAD